MSKGIVFYVETYEQLVAVDKFIKVIHPKSNYLTWYGENSDYSIPAYLGLTERKKCKHQGIDSYLPLKGESRTTSREKIFNRYFSDCTVLDPNELINNPNTYPECLI